MTVAVIDDDIKCINRTIGWLNTFADVTVLFTAINGLDYLQKLQAHKTNPDIVLMDIGMRVMDGCAATFYSKLTQPHIKIIAYTSYNDYDMIRNCFMCGVDGFVIKVEANKVLPTALATVVSNNHYFDSNLKYNGFTDVQYNAIINYKNTFWEKPVEKIFNITKRERLFIALASTSLTYKEVAELMIIEEATAQQMYNRIAKKLELRSVKDLATFALQNGLAMQASFLFSNKKKLPYSLSYSLFVIHFSLFIFHFFHFSFFSHFTFHLSLFTFHYSPFTIFTILPSWILPLTHLRCFSQPLA